MLNSTRRLAVIKSFCIAFVSFVILDFLWLGYVVKSFNLKQLAEIGRIENGNFSILFFSAILVYVMMSALMTVFVLPRIGAGGTWLQAFGWGAIMGLLVYGVFDMTNLSILKSYPVSFSIADMAWGTTVFGFVAGLTFKGQSYFGGANGYRNVAAVIGRCASSSNHSGVSCKY